jgi:hypothetical protein
VNFRVEYLFDGNDTRSECWTFLSLLPGLQGALALARDGLADVRDCFGAKGFRILDMSGKLVAEEFSVAEAKPQLLAVRSD